MTGQRDTGLGEVRSRHRAKPGGVERLDQVHTDGEAIVDDQDRAHEPRALYVRASSAGPMSWSGNTRSTAPHATASRGIPYTILVASSCATVNPPASRIASKPVAPSRPMPVNRPAAQRA